MDWFKRKKKERKVYATCKSCNEIFYDDDTLTRIQTHMLFHNLRFQGDSS